MEWIQVSIDTTHEGIEALTSALEDIGIRGFEIEDPADFCEFMNAEFPYRDYVDDDLVKEKTEESVKVKIYVSANAAGHEQLAAVRELLSSLSSDDIKKGLSGGIKNVNYDALKRFMKNE